MLNGIHSGSGRTLFGLRQAQRLFGAFVLAVVASALLFEPSGKPFETLLLASTVILLGCWPLYQWLGARRRDAIPVLAFHGVFYAVSFGVAGLMEPGQMFNLDWTTEAQRQLALLMVVLGLVGLYLGYFGIGPGIIGKRPRLRWPLQVKASAYGPLSIVGFPALVVMKFLVDLFGLGIISQIVSSLYSFVFYLLLYALFSHRLTGTPRIVFLVVILPYQLILASGLANGQIAGVVTLSVAIGITYAATRGRAPYHWAILAFAAFALLQPIKGDFRGIIWEQQVRMSPLEKLETFFGMGLDYYLSEQSTTGDRLETGGTETFDRINHLMVTAAVIVDTPSRQPFMLGETYLPLLTKWIPRFLWSGKPTEDLGNTWGRRYGYLGANDYVTSFNLPWLPEMYMNFGATGVFVVSLLIGILFHWLATNFWRAPIDASSFAFGMMLGTPFFFVESNLSLMMGRIIINMIALSVLCYILARLAPRFFVWK